MEMLVNAGMPSAVATIMIEASVAYAIVSTKLQTGEDVAKLAMKDFQEANQHIHGAIPSGIKTEIRKYVEYMTKFVNSKAYKDIKNAEAEEEQDIDIDDPNLFKAADDEAIENQDADTDIQSTKYLKQEKEEQALAQKLQSLIMGTASNTVLDNYKYFNKNSKASMVNVQAWNDLAWKVICQAIEEMNVKQGKVDFKNAMHQTKQEIQNMDGISHDGTTKWAYENLGVTEKVRLFLNNLCFQVISTNVHENMTDINRRVLEVSFEDVNMKNMPQAMLNWKKLLHEYSQALSPGKGLPKEQLISQFVRPFREGSAHHKLIYQQWIRDQEKNNNAEDVTYEDVVTYFRQGCNLAHSTRSDEIAEHSINGVYGNNGKSKCGACGETDHKFNTCPKYLAMSKMEKYKCRKAHAKKQGGKGNNNKKTNGKGGKGAKGKGAKFKGDCFNCGGHGHRASECQKSNDGDNNGKESNQVKTLSKALHIQACSFGVPNVGKVLTRDQKQTFKQHAERTLKQARNAETAKLDADLEEMYASNKKARESQETL